MNPLTKFNHIPWKYVVGMNLSVLALAVTFATLKPTTSTTESRSQAKDESPIPLAKPIFDPANPPQLIDPDISWAKVGDAVVIKSQNMGKIPFGTLSIGQVLVSPNQIVAWEPNQIVITVPPNSISAPIILTYTPPNGTPVTLSTKSALTITTVNK